MNINETIHNELEEFKGLLNDLSPAVRHIEREIKTQEIQTQTIEKINQKYNEFVIEIKAQLSSFTALSEQNKDFIQKIDEIDFPIRLDKLENSVNQTIRGILEASEAFAVKTENLVDKINQIDFPAKFESVEKRIEVTLSDLKDSNIQFSELIKENNQRLIKDIDAFFRQIQDINFPNRFDEIQTKVSDFLTDIKSSIEILSKETNEHNKQINELNLPTRFEKLDATISGINAGVQNIQTRLENLESNLKENQNNALEKILNRLNDIENKNKNWFAQLLQIINRITFFRIFRKRKDILE